MSMKAKEEKQQFESPNK